jgi:hypothetical protein
VSRYVRIPKNPTNAKKRRAVHAIACTNGGHKPTWHTQHNNILCYTRSAQVQAACGHVAELVDYLALAGCAPAWVPLGATALLLVAVLGYLLLLMATTADRYALVML